MGFQICTDTIYGANEEKKQQQLFPSSSQKPEHITQHLKNQKCFLWVQRKPFHGFSMNETSHTIHCYTQTHI